MPAPSKLHLENFLPYRLSVLSNTVSSAIAAAYFAHFGLSIPNFGIQELMPHGPEAETVFSHGYGFHDGYLHISDAPGLGVDIDEAEAAKWPYVRAYLPVNRLADGTLFNW